jgi:hypothetical protein
MIKIGSVQADYQGTLGFVPDDVAGVTASCRSNVYNWKPRGYRFEHDHILLFI